MLDPRTEEYLQSKRFLRDWIPTLLTSHGGVGCLESCLGILICLKALMRATGLTLEECATACAVVDQLPTCIAIGEAHWKDLRE